MGGGVEGALQVGEGFEELWVFFHLTEDEVTLGHTLVESGALNVTNKLWSGGERTDGGEI